VNRRPKAFTLVELLVVIAILAILMGILVWGIGGFGNQAKVKDTRTRMETLKSMMEQLRLANNQKDIPYYDNTDKLPANWGNTTNANVGLVVPGQAARYPVGFNAAGITQKIMGLMRAVPTNATILQNVNSTNYFLRDDANNKAINPPVFVDGWGNPILCVPGGPLNDPNHGGLITRDKTNVQFHHQAPNNRPFFASAGPDGNFDTDFDNVYSFEN
jgi:prepilin-type N-terminal cleavage/methylation domain-containing protein